MARDPMVNLIFSHFTPRYVATGVDPNDLERLVSRIERWDDWCSIWSDEARRHEKHAAESATLGRRLTAAESHLRAAIYYHYAKHLFAAAPGEYRAAHDNMLRCYTAAAPDLDPPMLRVEFPFEDTHLVGWLRRPRGGVRAPVAIILPGLDACKEELHAWSDAFLDRGMATLTLDGPGQGETAFHLPIRTDWGRVIGAVIDVLERRDDVDGGRVGVVGQSLGAFYAPLAASGEPRLKACVANCGPFDFAPVLPQMPLVSQQVFSARAHALTQAQADAAAAQLTLDGKAQHIRCPLLIVFGGGDRIIPPAEGERLAKAASGPTELVVYEDGNHVCFNISYRFRPLTADWMAEHL
ncbi:MAG: alpha/beta fold hydrolase [Rhodocyclaceae bacterium]|nr:alpha/beta fold hydrolase [Rhodocyclaceae bacterium]MCA3076134.1 alpha/beta fold hydrolase [Rhodocyclaceae bacterium]MCA3089409.1 alpha/beta fold hydrolase [Rhodocyclaceae bacterium]MCA3092970.1 alpha/beta fold hydrolase [Rhodocyclaceae bacterium]MCA3096939.1 alpha/beta fold hydrolase [Rhodocyclaceae bacterium]